MSFDGGSGCGLRAKAEVAGAKAMSMMARRRMGFSLWLRQALNLALILPGSG